MENFLKNKWLITLVWVSFITSVFAHLWLSTACWAVVLILDAITRFTPNSRLSRALQKDTWAECWGVLTK